MKRVPLLNEAQKEFKALMEAAGWNPAETARQILMSRSAVSQILKGKNSPTLALERLRAKANPVIESKLHPSPQSPQPPKPKNHGGPFWGAMDRVPIISWASAGDAREYQDEGGEHEMVPTDCKDPNSYALAIEGDSMEPRYLAGDYVIVSPNLEAQNGDLVIAKTKRGEVYFKLHHRVGIRGEVVRLTSYNPAYPPIEFPKGQLRFCHPVHSVLRKLKRS